MMEAKRLTKDEVLALRGLRLPFVALRGMQRAGIYCQPSISIQFQQATQSYAVRGVESGGAIAQIGSYCGFVDGAGLPLRELHPVNSIAANGLHGAVVSANLVRIQMFRAGTSYELLLTSHSLVQLERKTRPKLHNSVLFQGRRGTLELELWGRDRQLHGLVVPVFYDSNGAQTTVPDRFHDAVLRVTAGACCVGCRHSHLAGSWTPRIDWREANAG